MEPQNTYDLKKIIIFGIILIAIVALIGYLIFRKTSQVSEPRTDQNLFPFGTITPSNQSGTSTEPTTPENPVIGGAVTSGSADRLRVIANYPVTGFFPFMNDVIMSEPKLDPVTQQTTFISRAVPTNYIRFNAKQNGFLADAEMTKNVITVTQRTDTPVLNAEEVWFSRGGSTITYRSWNGDRRTISSYIGSLPNSEPLTYCQNSFTTPLKTKSRGTEVTEFQKYANAKTGSALTLDGVFGAKAATAVTALRKTFGLDVGGYDQSFITALNNDCASIKKTHTDAQQGTQSLTGDFIDEGIIRGDTHPEGTNLFFLKEVTDGVRGFITDGLGKGARLVFQSPFTEWKPQWVNRSLIALTTLASSEADGYFYTLDSVSGSLKKQIGPVRGLTTLVNPTGTMSLVGQTEGRRITIGTVNLINGERNLFDLATLPAKCTWANATLVFCAVPQSIPSGQYPDDWYQGNVQFRDAFWRIDLEKKTTDLLISPSQSFDAIQLKTSPDVSYLYFINKIDGSLWSYRLSDE